MADAKVHELTVQYCGGWGYGSRYNKFVEAVKADFPGKFDFKALVDAGVTGNFEIKHGEALIYSKKNTGKFPIDDEYKVVKEALAKIA